MEIKCNKLKKYYTTGDSMVKAVDNINLSIKQGDFICVVGKSGSGKSTLLNLIGGIEQPDSGQVKIKDIDIFKLSDEERTIFRRRNIGFIFQDFNLISDLNVEENILLPIELDGKEVEKAFFDEVVSWLGLKGKLKQNPNHLSGGEQQRVAIARAIITKPTIVLADEPTGNLDSKTSQDVLGLFKNTSNKYKQTILMITHNEDIAQLADYTIRIKDGKLLNKEDDLYELSN